MIGSINSALSKEGLATLTELVTQLEKHVQEGHFTAWSLGNSAIKVSAFFADEARHHQGVHPVFDLGSLTKPLFGGMLFILKDPSSWQQRGQVRLSPTEFLGPGPSSPELVSAVRRAEPLSFASLFNHSSGLPAWTWFGRGLFNKKGQSLASPQTDGTLHLTANKRSSFRETLLKSMFNQAISSPKKQAEVRYSDCGYYALARALENTCLSHWGSWQLALNALNAELGSSFFHASLSPAHTQSAVPYFPYIVTQREYLGASTRVAREFGAALDTNANLLAALCPEDPEVSCHAGLFGTISDVEAAVGYFSPLLFQAEHSGLGSLQETPLSNARFSFCFDTPTGSNSLSAWPEDNEAKRPPIFGHLGYTGTSFWMKPSPQLQHNTLLTNRTARRSLRRAPECPRLFVFEAASELAYAKRDFDKSSIELSELGSDDWQEIRQSATEDVTLHWNDSDCNPFPSVNELRRTVGRALWKLS